MEVNDGILANAFQINDAINKYFSKEIKQVIAEQEWVVILKRISMKTELPSQTQ
jgi:hypothetical protein